MASTNKFRRKEVKYYLSERQMQDLLRDILSYIEPDLYAKYTICNIYMDTPDYRLIRRSIEKPKYKEKMRIRSYGTVENKDKVFVELKKKYKGVVYKRRVTMLLGEAVDYIEGYAGRCGQIENELDYFLDYYKNIVPAMYISYDRIAYHGLEDKDLRITFDSNILWRDYNLSLNSKIEGNKLIEEGFYLLEIKCSESMPMWLVESLSKNKIYKTSFSKYGKAYMEKIRREREN